MLIICGGFAEYYVNQKAYYTGLPNISSTVCISRTAQSRSELSADLTGVNVEVGWILFCLFRDVIYESACTMTSSLQAFVQSQFLRQFLLGLHPVLCFSLSDWKFWNFVASGCFHFLLALLDLLRQPFGAATLYRPAHSSQRHVRVIRRYRLAVSTNVKCCVPVASSPLQLYFLADLFVI